MGNPDDRRRESDHCALLPARSAPVIIVARQPENHQLFCEIRASALDSQGVAEARLR
jgi:hypothetical protein